MGQEVELTAAVTLTLGDVVPIGAVTFTDDFTGSQTELGTVDLDANGQAVLPGVVLGVGTHSITAEYSGDDNANGSTSSTLNQVVAKQATTTTLTSSANSVVSGQPVTLTATVSPVSATARADTVMFRTGVEQFGPVAVDADGRASYDG